MVQIHQRRYRNWVHGSDVNVENPDEIEELNRDGSGTSVSQNIETSNSFHFAIPTPTEINNVPTVEVEEVYLHARLTGTTIDRVTVHEGEVQIFDMDVNIQDIEKPVTINQTFDVRDDRIQSAINLGVEVDFTQTPDIDDPNLDDPTIKFISGGAQFNAYTEVGRPGDVAPEPGRVEGTISFSTEKR